MNRHIRAAIIFSALGTLVASPSASAEDIKIDRSTRAFREAEDTLHRSTQLYKTVSEGKMGKIPQSVLDRTKCVAMFPSTMTVSAGIGGIHGDGVGFCKTAEGTWQNPMFLNLIGGSLGLQAGVKSADIVLYITGDKAADALKKGTFKIGGELSAVAGTLDKTFSAPQAEVIAYQKTEGLFAGASIDGVSLSRDESDERAFYGTREAVLTEKIPSDLERDVNELRNALPTHVG